MARISVASDFYSFHFNSDKMFSFLLSFKKASFEFEVHLRLSHVSKIIHSKSVTCLMYRFHCKMIIQVDFNRYIARQDLCRQRDLNPSPSDLHLLARAFTSLKEFQSLQSIIFPLLLPNDL